MAFLLLAVGYLAGELLLGKGAGIGGLGIAGIVWMILSIVAYYQGKNIFLSIAGAQKIKKEDHPRLFNVVEEMVIASQLPKIPDIYIMDDPAPNAFATGRNLENCAVAITTGLLNKLNRDELQGVIAHEIGHIKNRDILFMSMIGVMLGAIVMIADITMRTMFYGGGRRRSRTSSEGGQAQAVILIIGIILMILAPFLAQIIYFAASRKREYLADASAAQFTRYPAGLAQALEKIAHTPIKMKRVNRVTAPMFIINPLQKMGVKSASLFSTHPPIAQRVKILRTMAGGAGYMQYDQAFRQITQSSKQVIPKSALKEPSTAIRIPGVPTSKSQPAATIQSALLLGGGLMAEEPSTLSEKTRESTDAIWRARNYKFIDCSCGAKLKIPPQFPLSEIKCLRCGNRHLLS